MASDARIGTEIAGYRIESVLGRGGMSVVYLAEHVGLKRKAALKLMVPELAVDDRFRERFVRESQMAAALDHPNIIPIYEAGEIDGVLYIAMRYVRGTDLRALLQDVGALPPERALAICSQAAAALDAAHVEGLVHRDVKPANILLAPGSGADSPEHVYLSDFGVTKRASSASGLTGTGQFIGTLDYAAPEQIEGRPLDGRTDVYSLGCVLYECLTGEVPFPRDAEMAVLWAHMSQPPPKVTEQQPNLADAIDEVVAKAMAKLPDDRYATCGELIAAARLSFSEPPSQGGIRDDAVAAGVPATAQEATATEAPPPSSRPREPSAPPRRPRRPLLSRRNLVPLAAIVAVVLVVIVVPLATRNKSPSAPGATSPAAAQATGLLVRIDQLSARVATTIPVGTSPMRVAAGAGAVWVADSVAGTVARIDPTSGKIVKRIPVGKGASGIAVGFGSVWVANTTDGQVRRIDPASNEVSNVIPVGAGIQNITVGGHSVWVANNHDTTIARIDPSRNLEVSNITFGKSLTGEAQPPYAEVGTQADLAEAGGKLWISGWRSYNGTVIGLWSLNTGTERLQHVSKVVDSTSGLGSPPSRLVVVGGSAWITASLDHTLRRLDLQTLKASVIPTGRTPVAITAAGGFIWVANRGDKTVWKFSADSGQAVKEIALPGIPTSIAAGEGGIWVTLWPKSSG
jgi:serine/threonine protein kinase/streptogramin lyase